jgi:Patatin-like phospholipase
MDERHHADLITLFQTIETSEQLLKTAGRRTTLHMKRLAVTIAGAVSLGSYESGVLYEVLDAIGQHNRNPATVEADRITVDVLTGASAGGMTAIILAQKLLFNGDEFIGPYDNPLYNTWVKRIGMDGLQATQDDELALHSLFSSDLIESISKETLMARYASSPPSMAVRHTAAGDEIRVGVALTNLNGVAYGYPVQPAGKFDYIDYCDQLTRHVVAATCDNAEFWEPLRQAAVASGAFPVAFRAQDMQRSAKGEPDDYNALKNLEPWPQDPATFTYSDGGILQNQPLGMAKNLVDMIDNHQDQESRFYLFVSPHAKDPDADDGFHEGNADYVHLIKRLLGVVMGQSGFQDWITAQGINRRVALLDDRATGLKTAMLTGEIDIQALAITASSILALFFQNGEHTPPGATAPESIEAAKSRIAAQYSAEMSALSKQPGQADAFRDAVLAFETAAELGARDFMNIYGVTATDRELAGAGVQAFLGFFDQNFRDHDYDTGRAHARAVLTDPALSKTGAIGPIVYTGSPIRPIDARLDGLKLSEVPVADLEKFKEGTRRRTKQMVRELLGPYLSVPLDPLTGLAMDAALNHLIARL